MDLFDENTKFDMYGNPLEVGDWICYNDDATLLTNLYLSYMEYVEVVIYEGKKLRKVVVYLKDIYKIDYFEPFKNKESYKRLSQEYKELLRKKKLKNIKI